MRLNAAERSALPRTHGHLDRVLLEPKGLEIEGWMLDPERPFETIGLYVDGEWVGVAKSRERRDVAQVFAHVPHSAESAYLRDFVYSRHGRSRFGLRMPFRMRRHTPAESGGILDDIPNRSLGCAVPEDHYRNVYQTREYTQHAWSEHFRVIDFVELGLDHYQDLVVMVRAD